MYDAKPGMKSGVTIDLIWVNQQADDNLVACLVDVDDDLNHHSDHHALITVVSLKRDESPDTETVPSSDKAWHKANHARFITELKAHISPINTPRTPADIILLDPTSQTQSSTLSTCHPQV